MKSNPMPNQDPNGSSTDWLPRSREHVQLDTDHLLIQVQQRRTSMRKARHRIAGSSLAIALAASAICVGFYQPLGTQQDNSAALATQLDSDAQSTFDSPDQASDGELSGMKERTLQQLASAGQSKADEVKLAELEQQLKELQAEGERLKSLRREQKTWIVREELSRTDLLAIELP